MRENRHLTMPTAAAVDPGAYKQPRLVAAVRITEWTVAGNGPRRGHMR
jgi:hypothetical protein